MPKPGDTASDGEPRIFLNNLAGVIEDGLLLRIWGIQRDVTEQKRAETKLQVSEDRLQGGRRGDPAGDVGLRPRNAEGRVGRPHQGRLRPAARRRGGLRHVPRKGAPRRPRAREPVDGTGPGSRRERRVRDGVPDRRSRGRGGALGGGARAGLLRGRARGPLRRDGSRHNGAQARRGGIKAPRLLPRAQPQPHRRDDRRGRAYLPQPGGTNAVPRPPNSRASPPRPAGSRRRRPRDTGRPADRTSGSSRSRSGSTSRPSRARRKAGYCGSTRPTSPNASWQRTP